MIAPILEKALAGERLTPSDALTLFKSADLAAIGRAADAITRRMHPENYRTYNIDRNINYTNVCTAVCDFCAFYRKPGHEEGYVLPREVLLEKIAETVQLGGDQILLQGGLHPEYKLEWYEEMLRDIRKQFPTVNVHGFSPPEIHHFTKVNKLPLREVLSRLKEAGLGSLPGGGGEILVDRVRKEMTRGKVLSNDWLNVMRVWHELGGVGSATMMFGHIETLEERVDHLIQLRDLQDETGHFLTFTPLSFHPEGTELEHIEHATADDDLRTIAVSRLMLDNFEHVKSFWIMNTVPVTQAAIWYGADDVDGTVHEYEITYKDDDFGNKSQVLTRDNMIRMIEEVGRVPIERDSLYNEIVREDEPVPEAKMTALPMAKV